MSTKPSMTTAERREIFRLASQTQQLIDELADDDRERDADLLALVLAELRDRADIELLARILDRNAHQERQIAAAREHDRQRLVELDQARQRADEVAEHALTVDCPTCHQPAGEPCVTTTAYPRPRAPPHSPRIKASDRG